MQFSYNPSNNRLRHISDAVAAATSDEDLDNQSDDNYQYDALGNMTDDESSEIETIAWNVRGKLKTVTKTDGTIIAYRYDGTGERIMKKTIKNDVSTRATPSFQPTKIVYSGSCNLNEQIFIKKLGE